MIEVETKLNRDGVEIPLGSLVDYASLRNQDLIPAFIDLVREYAPVEYSGFVGNGIPAYAQDDDCSVWWNSDEAYGLLGELTGVLDSIAPDGYYFGASEGNGSDFGYWEDCP